MARGRLAGDDYPAEVLAELRRQLERAIQRHEYYPLSIERSWCEGPYVCVVYRTWGRREVYGLCRDVLDPVSLADEADARETATMIRYGDLEEPLPYEGSSSDPTGPSGGATWAPTYGVRCGTAHVGRSPTVRASPIGWLPPPALDPSADTAGGGLGAAAGRHCADLNADLAGAYA